jgi:hypothetical protein
MRKNLELERFEYFIFPPKHQNMLKGIGLGFEVGRHPGCVS